MCFIDMCLYFLTIGAGLDFTCYNRQPLFDPNSGNDDGIGGYKSGNDLDVVVSFSRALDTGTGSGLPAGYYIVDHEWYPDKATLLYMPSSGGKERFGVFNCEGTKNGYTYEIPTIILQSNGNVVIPVVHNRMF